MGSVRVGVLTQLPNLLKELRIALPNLTFFEATPDNEDLKIAEIIIADYDLLGPILYDLPKVKFVQGTWAGVDALLPHVRPTNLPVFPIVRYSGQHFGRLISEYVVACVVNHERDFLRMYDNQKNADWNRGGKISDYRTIGDLNIGVLGIGNIGSRLGTILKALGATVFAYGRRPAIEVNDFPYITEYFSEAKLCNLLKKCDYVINTLPNTAETKGLLNGNVLENCKEKQAVFVNVGRGSIISDGDLIAAIQNNWISMAYLDVFNTEPLPSDNQLWKLTQVKISPHVAAMSRAKDIAEQFLENFNLYTNNRKFPTLIDFSKEY